MYRVQLQNFEGPLDLLLFFIKRDELDIYDIPISYITEQFLEYLSLMEELDLDIASEFFLMASMLMSIKAKMMLPREEAGEELPEEDDPRFELVQKLLEYKRYKEMGDKLSDMDERTQKKYRRGNLTPDEVDKQVGGEALKEVSMFDLIAAFHHVITGIKEQGVVHRIENVRFTIETQTEFILNRLQHSGRQTFKELCSGVAHRVALVVTFLALLEMIKEQQINLYIGQTPADFHIALKPVDEILNPHPL